MHTCIKYIHIHTLHSYIHYEHILHICLIYIHTCITYIHAHTHINTLYVQTERTNLVQNQ